MSRTSIIPILKIFWSPALLRGAAILVVFGSVAIAAQDRYAQAGQVGVRRFQRI